MAHLTTIDGQMQITPSCEDVYAFFDHNTSNCEEGIDFLVKEEWVEETVYVHGAPVIVRNKMTTIIEL